MSEEIQLLQVTSDDDKTHIHQLFLEYAQLIQRVAKAEFGISVDTDETLNGFMSDLNVFDPPGGRIILAKCNDEFVGIGCLKQLSAEIGEIKRMFVSPNYRRKGLGKEILEKLIEDARSIGYAKLRLDSPKPFSAAHRLYERNGFHYIDAYEGSEAAEVIPDLAVYMEMDL